MNCRKWMGLACVMAVLTLGAAAQAIERVPDTYRFRGEDLIRAREKYRAGDKDVVATVEKLKASADKALADGPWSVTFKKGSLEGLGADVDAHTYISIAPYYWPNPATANHLPYVARDGERNPEFADYDAKPLMELTDHVDVLALASFFTGDQKYYDRAALLIRTWFLDEKTRMKPALDHCQLVKGENTGYHSGVIEARRFIDMIDAIEMMKADGNQSWAPADDTAMRAWIGDFLNWLQTGKVAVEESWQKNNHGTLYDVQVVTYKLWLGDAAGAKDILERDKIRRIWVQIDPDGKQPFELARTRAFWYEEFNLNALAQLAELGRRTDVDLWNFQAVSEQSIRKAVDWLIPYATGQKKWTYEQLGGVSAKELIVPLRQSEWAWKTDAYESAIAKLVGQDVMTDNDYERPLFPREMYNVLYPPPQH